MSSYTRLLDTFSPVSSRCRLPDVVPGNRLEFQTAGGASRLEILTKTIRRHTQELSRLCHRIVTSLTAGFIPCFVRKLRILDLDFMNKFDPNYVYVTVIDHVETIRLWRAIVLSGKEEPALC